MLEMVSLQILSKILQTHNLDILEINAITVDYFPDYADEFEFILNHYKEWGTVPDKATFLSKFPDIELLDVAESDDYLISALKEEYLFNKTLPVVQRVADLMKVDSNKAVEYMINSVKDLTPQNKSGGVDIIQLGAERLKAYEDRRDNQSDWFFTTGFEELDGVVHGLKRGEELFVIFARTNQGKSWILEKMCVHIWELGFNVGYISPEMGDMSIGYRFDTLYKNFSNSDLVWGNSGLDVDKYKEYINNLKEHKNKFIVSTPNNFGKKITVSKLRNFVIQNKLDVLAVDGITYLSDERGKTHDNKTTSLTNISEDLMELSVELNIPILVVVQANRNGAVHTEEDDTPDLESIRDSDGISHNASTVLSLRQNKDGVLIMQVKKQRFGRVNDKLCYDWNINTGEFVYLSGTTKPMKMRNEKPKEDVF